MALQESTYDRAQEGLTTTGHFPNDGTGTKMQKALKIGTLNCKGANHISAREEIVHMMKTHKLDVLFFHKRHTSTQTLKNFITNTVSSSPLVSRINNEKKPLKQETWQKLQ